MSDWSEQPGFPKRFTGGARPVGVVLRIVRGETARKGGQEETLTGREAYLQRLELELIDEYRKTQDVVAAIEAVLAANAKHLDVVEWCKLREQEIDLALRVYSYRGVARLHAGLDGPLGRFADAPLPDRAKPLARSKDAEPKAPTAEVYVQGGEHSAPATRASRLQAPVRRSLRSESAQLGWSDAVAFTPSGQLVATLSLRGQPQYATIEPRARIVHEPLPTLDELRAERPTALLPAKFHRFVQLPDALVRIETFSENGHRSFERFRVTSLGGDRATIMQKPWTARTGEHALGIWNDQFLRVLISGDESKLLAVELSTGKSTTVALPVERAKGAIVDRSDQGVTLRLVTLEDEHRLPLRMGSKLEVDSTSRTVTPHGLAGSVRPAPGGGWFTCSGSALRFVGDDGADALLFSVPEAFGAARPWVPPGVTDLGDGATLVVFGFVEDVDDAQLAQASRCEGAVVVREGAVVTQAHSGRGGAFHIGSEVYADVGRMVSCAARSTGEIALLTSDLSVLWHPPS